MAELWSRTVIIISKSCQHLPHTYKESLYCHRQTVEIHITRHTTGHPCSTGPPSGLRGLGFAGLVNKDFKSSDTGHTGSRRFKSSLSRAHVQFGVSSCVNARALLEHCYGALHTSVPMYGCPLTTSKMGD